jgi:p24 family protein alpha
MASWLASLFLVGLLILPVKALYFYMDGTAQKCFYEELPKDTLVVGTERISITLLAEQTAN